MKKFIVLIASFSLSIMALGPNIKIRNESDREVEINIKGTAQESLANTLPDSRTEQFTIPPEQTLDAALYGIRTIESVNLETRNKKGKVDNSRTQRLIQLQHRSGTLVITIKYDKKDNLQINLEVINN